MWTITRLRLKRDRRGVSNIIVVVLSLVIIVAIVANIVLWSYEMNQLDWEKMKETLSITNVERTNRSSWFVAQSEYTVNIGSRISGNYTDTQAVDDQPESFREASDWWNANYSYRRQITIVNNMASTLDVEYSVCVTIDTASLISAGKMLPSGNDLRVVYWDGTWTELDRDVVYMNTNSTQIWFATQAVIGPSTNDDNYYIYYGNSRATNLSANKSNVYRWFDDFNRTDNPDITTETSYSVKTGGGNWSIENNQLKNIGASGDPNKLIIAALGNVSNDIDMLVKINVTSFAGGDLSRMGLSCCMDTDLSRGSGYCGLLHGDTSSLDFLNDLRSWGTMGTYSWSLSTWYYMRFRVIDPASKLGKVKVWQVGTTEPDTWTVDGNFGGGTARSYGEVGFGGSRTTDTTYFDDILIRYITDPEPSTSLGLEEQNTGFKMEWGFISVNDTFTTVDLANTYISPIIVSVPSYTSGVPRSVRIRNATTISFEVRVQNPSGAASPNTLVYYIVLEEGVWTSPIKLEAQKYDTNTVGRDDSWAYDTRNYGQTYSGNLVVFHQVMTYNDSGWIATYVSRTNSRTDPPSSTDSSFRIALNGAEAVNSHGTETIGYVIVEQGYGTLGGVKYDVKRTTDSIQGFDNSPPFNTPFSQSFSSVPEVLVSSQLEMDGANGGWMVDHTITQTQAGLMVDEDQVQDAERSHTTETCGFWAFENVEKFSALNNRLDIEGTFAIDVSLYPLTHVQGIDIQLRFRAYDSGEKWYLKAYNWTAATYSDNGFNSTAGHTPTTGWDYYAVNLTDQWSSYVRDDGIIYIKVVDEGSDSSQTTVDVDFLGVRTEIDGTRFTFENEGALTSHLVSLWIIDSTNHQRYDINVFVNSAETKTYLRADISLPESQYTVKVVTERGNTAVYSGS